ncbi:MAG: TfoX/Sxy family protein [Propionibacteriales bacterium]|nr:TfoX/Sxy family protein [Propionibacteriales bacterium]
MAYDRNLAERLRVATGGEHGIAEKQMFGGVSFLVSGNLAVCASNQGDLMVRVDPTAIDGLVNEPGVARMEMGTRPMKGWVRVTLANVDADADLRTWVDRGVAFARSLPPK